METLPQAMFWLVVMLVIASSVYHLLSLYSAARFFRQSCSPPASAFTPPISILKPLRGAEAWLGEVLASFCEQDYPAYEIIFGVLDPQDPAIGLVEQLRATYPQRQIKLVINPHRIGTSAKVSNLYNICQEASHEILVISDCDACVGPDYLRSVVVPLTDERVGLVTCLYRPIGSKNFSALMEGLGLMGEFALGVLVARQLDGVRFAFGATAVLRQKVLAEFGGFAAIANFLGDDFLLGHLTAQRGYEVILSPYVVETLIPPYQFGEMFRHQLRWARSTKFRRPLGYVGLIFTYTTALVVLALLAFPTSILLWSVSACALAIRFLAAWFIGVVGFEDRLLRRYFYLLPIRDVLSFVVWVISFFGTTVYWCGDRYRLLPGGKLLPQSRWFDNQAGIIGSSAALPKPQLSVDVIFIQVPHQQQENYLCVPTAAAMVLEYFGEIRSPYELKVLSRGQPYNPNEAFTDFTITFFRDLLTGLQAIGYTWKEATYANNSHGFDNGLKEMQGHLRKGLPVLADTSLFGGHTIAIVGFDAPKQLLYVVDSNLPPPGYRSLSYCQFEQVWHSRETGFNGRSAIFTKPK